MPITISPKFVRAGVLSTCFILTNLLAVGQNQSVAPRAVATIRVIQVQPQADKIRVEIKATAPLDSPKIFRLQDPSRLVLDFSGAVPALASNRIHVNQQHVVAIRTSLFEGTKSANPVTRVVFDLGGPVEHWTATDQNNFVITLASAEKKDAVPTAIQKTVLRSPSSPPKSLEPNQSFVEPQRATNVGSINNQLNRINVSSQQNAVLVALEFEEPATPQTMFLENPSRVVLDFPNTSYGSTWNQPALLRVNGSAITAVRSALFRINPPVMRVVLDRKGSVPPKISVEGRTVFLQFGSESNLVRSETAASSKLRENVGPALQGSNTSQALPGIATRPPIVTYEGGLLTLDANNSTLTDVLIGIAVQTGASIDIPKTDGMQDLIVIKIGPARPRDVIGALLQGSTYNYYVIENSAGDLQKVILTPK